MYWYTSRVQIYTQKKSNPAPAHLCPCVSNCRMLFRLITTSLQV